MILSCLREERRLNMERIVEITNLQQSKLKTSLEMLVERGLIEAYGHSKDREYILSKKYYISNKENLGYVRQAGIDRIRYKEMIRKLALVNGGTFTKKEVMKLLEVTSNEAYSLIKEMQSEGVVEMVQSGKYAKYRLKDS